MAAGLVAGFRQSVGSDVDDPGFVQLVGELSLSSERFRRLWARHDVMSFEGAPVRLVHPQAGELMLNRDKLAITGTEGQLLVIYHARPGTPSAESWLCSPRWPASVPLRAGAPRATGIGLAGSFG